MKHRSKEASYSDPREHDGQKYTKEEKKKCDDRVTSRPKDRYDREPLEQFEDKSDFARESQEYSAKKPKLVSSSTDHGKGGNRRTFCFFLPAKVFPVIRYWFSNKY